MSNDSLNYNNILDINNDDNDDNNNNLDIDINIIDDTNTIINQFIEFSEKKKNDFEKLIDLLYFPEKNQEIFKYSHLKKEIFGWHLQIIKYNELFKPAHQLKRQTGMNDYMYIQSVNILIKNIKDYIKDNNLILDKKITQLEDCIIFSNQLYEFEKNNDLSKFYPHN